nr:unnamed protein product [Callosobruchus analis]
MQQILDDTSVPLPLEETVAVLTAGERTHWAQIRRKHFNRGVNKVSLDAIEKAAFFVTLDDFSYEFDMSTPSKLDNYGKALLHGKGYDRWFDKSFTLCVGENGRIGFNAEHTWQGCCLSPILFKICINEILRKWQNNCPAMGLDINGSFLRTLLFADDQCCVPNCTGNYKSSDRKVHIFKSPKDKDLREKWLRSIHRENFQISDHSVVCHLHFVETDILHTKPKLKPNAIPSIFPNAPSEQVQALIEQYRQNPCLYAVRSAAYQNRHARQAALETIHANITALRPSVTMAEIKTKFQALRSTFSAEHKKYQSSVGLILFFFLYSPSFRLQLVVFLHLSIFIGRADAPIMAHCLEYLITDELENRFDDDGNTVGKPEVTPPAPVKLNWDLKEVKEAIDTSLKVANDLISDLGLRIFYVIKLHDIMTFFKDEEKLISKGENAVESGHVTSLISDADLHLIRGKVHAIRGL